MKCNINDDSTSLTNNSLDRDGKDRKFIIQEVDTSNINVYTVKNEQVDFESFFSKIDSFEKSYLSSFLDNSLEHPSYLVKDVENFRNAIINSDFDKIKDLIHTFVGTELELESLDSAMEVAIVRRNIELVKYLVNIGGKVSPSQLQSVYYSGNTNFVISLENIGINLYEIESSYDKTISPLSHFIYINISMSSQYNKAFEHLLQAGFDLEQKSYGVDPLLLSISYFEGENYKRAYLYTKKLIDSGAVVSERHFDMMKVIKKNRPKLYKKVVDKIPQLKLEKI